VVGHYRGGFCVLSDLRLSAHDRLNTVPGCLPLLTPLLMLCAGLRESCKKLTGLASKAM